MANQIVIEGQGKKARVRNPWLVLLFTIITFGVYGWFWWYFINRELADLGRARNTDRLGDTPVLSVLAYTLGVMVFYIPQVWTIVTTNRRVQRAQRLTGGQSLNGWVAAALWIFTFTLGGIVYLQYELNKVWRAPGMRPVEQAAEDAAGDLERAEKLEQLYAAGSLTEQEYESEKERVGLT